MLVCHNIEDVVGSVGSMGEMRCIQNFSKKTEGNRPLWRLVAGCVNTLNKYLVVIKCRKFFDQLSDYILDSQEARSFLG